MITTQKLSKLWRNLLLVRRAFIGLSVIALTLFASVLIQLYEKQRVNVLNEEISQALIPTMEASSHILSAIELRLGTLERILLFGHSLDLKDENAWESIILPNMAKLAEIQRDYPDENTGTLLDTLEDGIPNLRREEREILNLLSDNGAIEIGSDSQSENYEEAKASTEQRFLPRASLLIRVLEEQIARVEQRYDEKNEAMQELSDLIEKQLWFFVFLGIVLVTIVGIPVIRSLIHQAHRARSLESVIATSSAPLMSCDLEFRITYVNQAMYNLFSQYEDAFRNSFPGFDPEKLIGTCIDIFHAKPKVQRDILSDRSRLPKKNEGIIVAGLEFSSNAGVLLDANDLPIGYFVEFKDQNDRAAYRDEVAKLIKACTSGDLGRRGALIGQSDAYRPMMEGINSVINAIVEPIPELQEQLKRLADGDLSRLMTGRYEGDHAIIKNALNAAIQSLAGFLTRVRDAADQVGSGAEKLSATNQSLSEGATARAASLEELTATMVQIGDQTRANAENASQANRLAEKVSGMTETGNVKMKQTLASIQEVSQESENINEILEVIDHIASQTNLLALNATIEAASAGESGKGFAVVAGEIKSLARQTGEATAKISETIQSLTQRVEQGLSLTRDTAAGQAQILEGIARVAEFLAEIDFSSREQNIALEETSRAITDLNQISLENAAAMEQSSSTSVALAKLAADLQELLESFVLPESRNIAA